MTIQKIRDIISPLELDPEVKDRITQLLAPLPPEGELPREIKDQVLELLDLEIDTNELLAQAYEKTASDVDQYVSDIEQATTSPDTTEE